MGMHYTQTSGPDLPPQSYWYNSRSEKAHTKKKIQEGAEVGTGTHVVPP